MKTYRNNYKTTGLSLLFSLLIIVTLDNPICFAQKYSRTISKDFSTNQKTILTIEHKYGDVAIQNWDKDQISFSVVVELSGSMSKERADQILNKVNINFTQVGDLISATTEYSDETALYDKKDLKVLYTVFVPKYISFNLIAKYCNVFINEIDGLTNLDIKYGKLNIKKLGRGDYKPMNQLVLGYSDGIIEDAGWIKLDLKYSDLTVRNAQALAVLTKYTKLYVDNVNSIACESEYDTYRIGTISNFASSAKYGDFQFNEISKKLSIDSKFTNLTATSMPRNFESISIVNSYGTFNIGIEEGASYNINGNAAYCKIFVPKTGKLSQIQENTKMSLQGLVGTDASTGSTVIINTSYGDVKLIK
jgi:hypothetical protein